MTTVLDASVLIAFFDSDDAHHEAALRILGDAADEELVLSSISLAEVLVGPPVPAMRSPSCAPWPAWKSTKSRCRQTPRCKLPGFAPRTGLTLPDCCVLLAAQTASAQAVATFDARLAQIARNSDLRA